MIAWIVRSDLMPKIDFAIKFTTPGIKVRMKPAINAAQPKIVIITGQSATQTLCAFTIASPMTNANKPDIMIKPVFSIKFSAIARKA